MKRRSILNRAAGLALLTPLALLAPLASHAHGSKLGELSLRHPHAYPTPPGLTTGAVYLIAIRNDGEQADRLLAASTPAAERVELHRMQMDGDIMRMRALGAIEIPPRSTVSLRQGSTDGYHLMLSGLRRPLMAGDRFALTLRFERAGEVTVEVRVEAARSGASHSH